MTGWILPQGGGLRGGSPLPGETSAISNGTSGWGPPPSGSVHSSGTNAWGSAPPPNNNTNAWGTANGNSGSAGGPIGGPIGGPNGGVSQVADDQVGPNQKMLNPAVSGAASVGGGGGVTSAINSAPSSSAPPPSAAPGITSWAAAAGKGLPPQTEPSSNGAANKPIEVLNSLREALYSPVSKIIVCGRKC